MTTTTAPAVPPVRHGGSCGSLERAAVEVRRACRAHGVDPSTLESWLNEEGPGLVTAARFAFGNSDEAPSRATMGRLVAAVEARLDLSAPLEVDLAGPGRHLLRGVRAVFAVAVLIGSGWVVIGSILTEQNAMAQRTSTTATFAVLAGALTVLALLEAAHIGAVALSTADVSTLEHSHQRVFALHRYIDTKEKLESYLAARQVGVVLIVFLISEVTRTVGVGALPGTDIAIPSAFDPLFRIGAPGALLVLVIGQVAPQIVTARRPAAMMNLTPMALAFHATRYIGELGLGRPAAWLVSWSKGTERIPSAPRERYVSRTVDVEGYGVLGVHRSIVVGATGTRAESAATVVFHRGGQTSISLDVATMPAKPNHLRVCGGVLDGDGLDLVCMTPMGERRLGDRRGILLSSTFAPRAGAFRAGDVLDVTATAEFDEALCEDFMVISAPTKVATMSVVLDVPPAPLPPAVLTLFRPDGEVLRTESVLVRIRDDGAAEFFVAVRYPDPGTLIGLCWAPTTSAVAERVRPRLEVAR